MSERRITCFINEFGESERIFPLTLLRQIRDMGRAGELVLRALIDATDEEFDAIIEEWYRTHQAKPS